MITLLDGHPIEPAPVGIAAALEAARARSEASGRIIIDVRADGRTLPGETLERPPQDAGGVGELLLVSADRAAFLRDTIADARESLDVAVARQGEAAGLIQQGKLSEASEPLSEALSTWQAVRDVVVHASVLGGVDPARLDVRAGEGSVKGEVIVDELVGALTEIKRSITEEDWSALGDAVGYDLEDVAERWRGLLDALSRAATTAA